MKAHICSDGTARAGDSCENCSAPPPNPGLNVQTVQVWMWTCPACQGVHVNQEKRTGDLVCVGCGAEVSVQ